MRINQFFKSTRGLENLLAFFSIFLLALFPFLEVIARKFFHTGIRNSTEYTHHLVLILTFIGAAITARENRHLSLTLNLKFKPGTLARIQVVNAFFNTAFCTAFALCSVSFLLNAFDPGEKIAIFPLRLLVMVMPLGYALMAFRFSRQVPGKTISKILSSLGFVFGMLLAWEALANTAHVLLPSSAKFFESFVPVYKLIGAHLSTPIIIVLIFSALAGVPIFIVLGGIGYMLFAHHTVLKIM